MEFVILGVLLGIGGIIGLLLPSPAQWRAGRKLQAENRSLREHLHMKMEIDATGAMMLKKENDQLKTLNSNLRITIQSLKEKPGRRELWLLQTYDKAINIMLAKAPGFAPTWQRVLEELEKDSRAMDYGVKAFVKRMIRPSWLTGPNSLQIVSDDEKRRY